jgi:cytoskeleton protein RodZ
MAKITRLTLDQTGGLERRRLHLREISEDSDVPLETVGQDLKTARMRKGEDLAAISAVLRIRKDQLQALEESNFDLLPGRAYTIGFVRAYAQYLGMHPGESVERLKAEIAGRNEAKEPVVTPAPRENRLPPGSLVLAFFLLIAVVYVLYYVVVSIGHMRTPPVTPVPARLSQLTGTIPPVAAPRNIAGFPHSGQISASTKDSAGGNL